ncbi:hypothetical protein HanIR_Chr15g0735261 [Helianthus annuus]|nr:hypothetical protein HanIR_Chr15g0735261 [Helianthus annuus]
MADKGKIKTDSSSARKRNGDDKSGKRKTTTSNLEFIDDVFKIEESGSSEDDDEINIFTLNPFHPPHFLHSIL